MAITVGSLFHRQRDRITEVLNKNITVIQSMLSPIWRDLITTSQGVGNPSELGRDLKLIKIFMGSFAGVAEQGATRNDFTLYGDATSHLGPMLHQQSLAQTWPDPTSGPNATPFRLAVGIRSILTNLMLTLGEKTAEATPAIIGQVVAPKIKGHANMIAHMLCNYFYLSQNTSYRICAMTNIASAWETVTIGGVNAYRLTFQPDNYATRRFERGMRIDLYSTAGTPVRANDTTSVVGNQTFSTRTQLVVESVSDLKNTVTIITPSNPATAGLWHDTPTSPATDLLNFRVMHANSTTGSAAFTGMAGINSWLKPGDTSGATATDNNLLLGTAEADATDRINVNINPEFMSALFDVSGPLTEYTLGKYLSRCHSAWDRHGKYLDGLLMSDGVLESYRSQKIGQYQIDRTNRTSNLMYEGAQEGFLMTFEGRQYRGYVDPCVEANTVYGVRLGGSNWKRYVPPSAAGASRFGELEPGVPFEFIGGALIPGGSDQLPIYNSAGTTTLITEGSQMPGHVRMQLVPEQPNMMKLINVTEDREYATNA